MILRTNSRENPYHNFVEFIKSLGQNKVSEDIMSRVADDRSRRAPYAFNGIFIICLAGTFKDAGCIADYYMEEATQCHSTPGHSWTLSKYARVNEFVPLTLIAFVCGLIIERGLMPL